MRAAAADAKRSGHSVIAVDRFGDRDLLSICERWIEYDESGQWMSELADIPSCPIVPVGGFKWPTYQCEGDSQLANLHSHLVAYPNPATLDRLNSPQWLGEIASRCEITFPETRHQIKGRTEPIFQPTVYSTMETNQWLRKPKIHAGGIGISFASENSSCSPQEFLQRRLSGKPIGANFIAWQNDSESRVELLGVFRAITYRRNRAQPFLYGGSMGPILLPPKLASTITRLAQAIATELNLLGLFNIDLLLGNKNELAMLEINPRYSASMELIPISTSLINWHLACYQHRPNIGAEINCDVNIVRQCPSQTFACKRVVYAKSVQQDVTFDSAKLAPSLPTITLCDLPRSSASIAPGEPVCTVLVTGAKTMAQATRLSVKESVRLQATR